VLSRLAREVVTVERFRTLADTARGRVQALGSKNVEVVHGDGLNPPPGLGMFDRIMVTAAVEQIPQALLDRLEPGGILIAPVGPQERTQTMVRVRHTATGLEREELIGVRFVPALPGIAREL
jgi:protein-L-isoaspartate(D-aspartate) O-methyltransferase